MREKLGFGGIITVILLVLITFGCWTKTVDQHEVAVSKNIFTGSVSQPVDQGFHIRPFVTWHDMETRRQQVPEGEGSDVVEVLTADQLRLKVDASYWFKIDGNDARRLFLERGDFNDVHNYVYDSYRNATRNAISEIAAADLLSEDRQGIGNRIEDLMLEELEGTGIDTVQYFLRDIDPPQQVKDRIEEKVSRQQDVQTERYQTQIERENARQRRVEAAGIADAQDSIQSSLTGQQGLRYLQWRKYEMLGRIANSEANATWVIPDALMNGIGSTLGGGM